MFIKHFAPQVCIFVQGAHHPPVHPEQPGLAGEEPGEVWQEASQVWLCCLHGARGCSQAIEPGPRVSGARQGRRQGDGRPACFVQQLDDP